MIQIALLIGMTVIVAGFYLFGESLTTYWKFRGRRVVTCPQTREAAAVTIDATHAARTSVWGKPHLRVDRCSRWPEQHDCAQACVAEIDAAPERCCVHAIVGDWYRDKACVLCQRAILGADGSLGMAALMAPDRTSMEWTAVRAQDLPSVLRSHQPLCWNCHISETFRRLHPDLALERPKSPRI
jgi:hypothetical protein